MAREVKKLELPTLWNVVANRRMIGRDRIPPLFFVEPVPQAHENQGRVEILVMFSS